MLILTYLLFFAEEVGRGVSQELRYNLTPFKEINRYITYRKQIGELGFFLNIYGNILLLVPLGFLLPAIFWGEKHYPVLAIGICFLFSVGVELTQLVTRHGCCDVDDVILNTIGGMIGYLLYRIYKFIGRKVNDSKKQKKN
ncbi:MAG: VanZ family protein [Lachnospiraceae bacterium]|nr:VanZ family protein [Lachnospiraceae bacterium]